MQYVPGVSTFLLLVFRSRHVYECRRCEYSLEPCGLVLFHYLGDHEKAALVANTAPHGNAKKSKVPFTRTLPIVLHGIKEKAMQQMYASSPRQVCSLDIVAFKLLLKEGAIFIPSNMTQFVSRNDAWLKGAL